MAAAILAFALLVLIGSVDDWVREHVAVPAPMTFTYL